jgi:hypothetical protein
VSAVVALAGTAGLVACGGGGDEPAPPPMGQLRVALTDAPGCGYDHVDVTVERLRVHRSAAATDAETGWIEIPMAGPKAIDLLTLNNGVIAELGQATLLAGQYEQIRLVLAPNRGNTVANSVTPRGMAAQPLDTPSGTQSGIKLTHGFTVAPDQLTDLLIDVDACKSIVERGDGTYGLKPVIAVMPRTGSGIAGLVDSTLTDVTVTAQKDGIVLRATRPAADGKFLLAPIHPAGTTYHVVFTAPDRTTTVVSNVPVTMNQITTVNSTALTLPASASGTVTGVVSPSAAAQTASVRALQKVGAIAAIEVAWDNTNLVGEYTLKLPTAEPRLAPYVLQPAALAFAGAGGAGKYTLEAAAAGYQTTLGSEITVVPDAVLGGQDFAMVPVP